MPPGAPGGGHGPMNAVRSGEVSDKTLWLWMINYLANYKKRFFILIILLTVFTILSAFLPIIQQQVIDNGILKSDFNTAINLVINFVILMLTSFIGSAIINYMLGKLGTKIIHDVRQDIFKNVQGMSMDYFETHNSGNIISIATNDVDQLNMVFGGQLAILLVNIIRAIVIVLIMLNTNWELTLLALLIVPIMLVFITFVGNMMRTAFKRARMKIGKVTQVSEQNISGIKVIKSYGREKQSSDEFDRVNWENREAVFDTGKIMSLFFPLITFVVYIFMSLIMLYAGYGLLNNGITLFGSKITIGELSEFNTYLIQLLFPIMGVAMFKQISDSALASAERIYSILREKNNIPDPEKPESISKAKGNIEFRNVSFNYKSREEKPINKNVELIMRQLIPMQKGFINALTKNMTEQKKLTFVERFIQLTDEEKFTLIRKLRESKNKEDLANKFAIEFKQELNYNDLAKILDDRLAGANKEVIINDTFDVNKIQEYIENKQLTNTQILDILSKKPTGNYSDNVKNAIEEYKKIATQLKGDVLQDINLKIKKGSTVAFVGETGAGKSTIIKLLARFYDVKKGEILIDGNNIKNYRQNDLRSIMGMVPQDSFLFTGSILDNIYYGVNKKPEVNNELLKITKYLGLHDFIKALPEGYNTILRERGTNISIGQRQLICFARVLLTNPKILMLDEATSSIDPYSEKIIQKAIAKASKGRTTIIIAHRLSTIKDADVICVIDKGKIIESGSHDELMKQKGHYYELINVQRMK